MTQRIDEYTKNIYRDERFCNVGENGMSPEMTGESDTDGRVGFSIGDDGSLNVVMPDGETASYENPAAVAEAERIDNSEYKSLIASLSARRGSLIEPYECEGNTWHLLKMNQFRVNEVIFRAAATGDGALAEDGNDRFRALILAVLQVGVVKDANDPTPYFRSEPYLMEDPFGAVTEMTELERFADEPEAAETIAMLFDRLTDMNPAVWPKKKAALALVAKANRESTGIC